MTVPRYMLDTNICIHIRQQRPAAVLERFRSVRPGEAVISVITFGELHDGVERSGARERSFALLQDLTTILPVQILSTASGEHYGEIRSCLQREGQMIGNNDLWIAAHARSLDLILVTNNEREFARVPDLRIENWAVPA